LRFSARKGESTLKEHRIILSTLLLVLTFGTVASQFAQNAPTATDKLDSHASMLGLVRTINTVEVTEASRYGSYEPWPILLAHHQEDFNSWLKRFYSSNEPNVQFRDATEFLPDWNLRLNVQADGKGYVLLVNDTSDKTGFAWISDESGIIRECKYLQ
jgi:hypothetical protein